MKRILTISLLALMAAAFTSCDKSGTDTQQGGEVPESDYPAVPADPQEESTDFSYRMLLIQHTGSACGYCPYMTSALSEFAALPEYKDTYNLVAAHAYNPDDNAYTEDAAHIESLFGVGGFPALTFNFTKVEADPLMDSIKEQVDNHLKEKADVGIAAASKIINGKVAVSVELKAAVENTYRISVWLLQDNIYSKQNDYKTGVFEDWMNYHNNCLMKMAGNGVQTKVYGRNVGTVAAGEKFSGRFSIEVENSWNMDDCKLLIIASIKNEEKAYDFVNSVACPINGSVAYDYISE